MSSEQIVQDASLQLQCNECHKFYKSESRLLQHKSKKHTALNNDSDISITVNNFDNSTVSTQISAQIPLNKLTYKPSITQDHITKTELVNKAALEYIIKNWDCLQFRPSVEEETPEWDPYKICKDYLERLDNNNEKTTFYKQKNSQGRFFAVKGLSLQSMPREVRHTIAAEYYWDLDFQNCHPQLLFQYCQKHNIDCAQLK